MKFNKEVNPWYKLSVNQLFNNIPIEETKEIFILDKNLLDKLKKDQEELASKKKDD